MSDEKPSPSPSRAELIAELRSWAVNSPDIAGDDDTDIQVGIKVGVFRRAAALVSRYDAELAAKAWGSTPSGSDIAPEMLAEYFKRAAEGTK